MRTAWDDWLPRLDAQRAELGAAIASYIEEGDARGAEMAAAVSGFWWRSGHLDEGRALLSKVVASGLATRPEVRYPLLQGLGTTLFRQGDNDAAERIFEAALADAETLEPISRVSALCDLSRVALRRGNFGSVRDHAHRAYELSETIPGFRRLRLAHRPSR